MVEVVCNVDHRRSSLHFKLRICVFLQVERAAAGCNPCPSRPSRLTKIFKRESQNCVETSKPSWTPNDSRNSRDSPPKTFFCAWTAVTAAWSWTVGPWELCHYVELFLSLSFMMPMQLDAICTTIFVHSHSHLLLSSELSTFSILALHPARC